MKSSYKPARPLSIGDIVEIEWLDTHSTDRLTRLDVEDLEDPGPTIAYGIVLKTSPNFISIASELCLDEVSDGTWIEQIPRGAVRKIRKLGKRALWNRNEEGIGRI